MMRALVRELVNPSMRDCFAVKPLPAPVLGRSAQGPDKGAL